MDGSGQFNLEAVVDGPLPRQARLSGEGGGHDPHVEMALAARAAIDAALVMVTAVAGGIIFDAELSRRERRLKLGANATRDRSFVQWLVSFLEAA